MIVGKRAAEKDQLIGANFCLCIQAPEKEVMASVVDVKIEENLRYIEKMDQCIKNVMQLALDQHKKFIGFHSKEYEKIGMAFVALGSAFEYNQKGMFSKASIGTFDWKLRETNIHI